VVLFSMTVWLVCINHDGRPVGIPGDLKKALGKE
jgi:acyl-CoA thioesterase FadM